MPKRKYQEALGAVIEAAAEPGEGYVVAGATGPADISQHDPSLGRGSPHGPEAANSITAQKTPADSRPSTSSDAVPNVHQADDADVGVKKQKKSVRWSDVTVYLFPRQQGFTCVPSSGGVTLGMTNEHSAVQSYTLTEHEMECRKNRLQAVQKRQSETSDSDEEMEDIEEAEEEDAEEDEEEEEGEEEDEEYDELEDGVSFPISVSIRQRRSLLREAGCEVDLKEREDCQFIRISREACGCQCQTVCNPDECSCSLNKIKCQVDRFSYPCGCTRDGCGNQTGRVEFNPVRVKSHYMSTISRLTRSGAPVDLAQEPQASGEFHYQQETVQYNNTGVQLSSTCRMDVAYSSHESFIQAPQCDYACSSLSSSTLYQIEPANVSVSMSSENYSSTTCQPTYDYYHMQPAYEVQSSSNVGISPPANTHPCCSNTTNGYLCTSPDSYCYSNEPANTSMISPTLHYIQPEEPTYQTLPPVSYGHPALDSHHPYDPSSSEGSRESSTSLDANSAPLGFGELIKQSLVETATA